MSDPATRRTPGLADLSALIAGYGLAALLARALWPSHEAMEGLAVVLIAVEYLWLGLAMSGPLVLLLGRHAPSPITHPRRPGHRIGVGRSSGPSTDDAEGATGRYTRAELAWLTIGGYWIALLFLVGPARLEGDLLPILTFLLAPAALLLWAFGPWPAPESASEAAWTHRAAVVLLATWPVAWAVLIALGLLVA